MSTSVDRRTFLKRSAMGTVALAGAPAIAGMRATTAFADDTTVRWDVISVDFATGTLSAGGVASASANDGSKITVTGTGTFTPGDSDDVTGGGTWKTFNAGGLQVGSGLYSVTGLVRWERAPGTPPLPHDAIGILADNSAGLAVLRVHFSDGQRGILTVSCHLVGTPDAVFEGITTTKGFIDYWNREKPPAPPANADRTTFHVMSEPDDD